MTPHAVRIEELLIAEALLELAVLTYTRGRRRILPGCTDPLVCATLLHRLGRFPEYWPSIDVLKLAAPFARAAALRTLKARP